MDEFTLRQEKQELYERLQQRNEYSLNGNERLMLRILREELETYKVDTFKPKNYIGDIK